MSAEVVIVGMAETAWVDEHNAALDELVFDVTHAALRQAGLCEHEVGLSVMASLDVYDGRSISSGLITPAAAGYLSDAYRIEGDMGVAAIAAAQAIAAGDAVGYATRVALRELGWRVEFLRKDLVGPSAEKQGIHIPGLLENDAPGLLIQQWSVPSAVPEAAVRWRPRHPPRGACLKLRRQR